MLQLFLRKRALLCHWIALGHQVANFDAVACRKHQWKLFSSYEPWNIQTLRNSKTGRAEYWISQKCRCRHCGAVRNFPLVQLIFLSDYETEASTGPKKMQKASLADSGRAFLRS